MFRRPATTPRLRKTDLISPGKAGQGAARANLRTALILMAIVTCLGTIGFVEIEGWDVWRAFYFTIVTVTTVGYGDEGLSDSGKKFTTLILLGGVTRLTLLGTGSSGASTVPRGRRGLKTTCD